MCSLSKESNAPVPISFRSIFSPKKAELDSKIASPERLPLNSIVQHPNPFGPAIGEVKAFFSCTYLGKKGDLYVATKAICFRRTIVFDLEVGREVIPWSSVRSISRKCGADSRTDGVSIATYKQTNIELRNLSASMDQSVRLFRQLWKNENLVRRPRIQRHGARDLLYQILSFEGYTAEERIPDRVAENDNKSEAANTFNRLHRKSPDVDRGKVGGMQVTNKRELQEEARAWKEVLSSKEPFFSEVPVMAMHLDCNMDDFFHRYIAVNAPHSIVSYHRHETGDYNVSSKAWELQDDGVSFKRTITYTHPVKIPMAPPKAQVLKKQIMRRYGNHGISIFTTTWTKGVPVSDCFHIEDRILIDNRSDDGVFISIAFDLRFTKYTMLRRIVERTTKDSINEFHRKYVEYLRRELKPVTETTKITEVHDIIYAPEVDNKSEPRTLSNLDSEIVQMVDKEQQFQGVGTIVLLLCVLKFMFMIGTSHA